MTDEIELSPEDLRAVVSFAAACAWRVLPVFEAARPDDTRPRLALEAAGAFAAGGPRVHAMRKQSLDAHRAAKETDGAAAHAALAAGQACAAAYLHPLADEHQAKHILNSAAYASLALATDAAWTVALATPEVRAVLRRYPTPRTGRTPYGQLVRAIDAALRA